VDRVLGTSLSLYGWEIVFRSCGEKGGVAVKETGRISRIVADTNVCFSCGSINPESVLRPILRNFWLVKSYNCPSCGKTNLFSETLEPKQS
jgi:hypothetical protein